MNLNCKFTAGFSWCYWGCSLLLASDRSLWKTELPASLETISLKRLWKLWSSSLMPPVHVQTSVDFCTELRRLWKHRCLGNWEITLDKLYFHARLFGFFSLHFFLVHSLLIKELAHYYGCTFGLTYMTIFMFSFLEIAGASFSYQGSKIPNLRFFSELKLVSHHSSNYDIVCSVCSVVKLLRNVLETLKDKPPLSEKLREI